MVKFWLQRTEDVSGVSGTGRVAEGVIFTNGKVALSWLTPTTSIVVYDSITVCEQIHGHEGRTRVVFE